MTKAFELFKESLEKISDEDFAKLLDEMENDPQGQGITIGEFFDAIHQKSSIDEIINFDSKNQVKSSVINDFLDKESLVKEVIKINHLSFASCSKPLRIKDSN